MSRSRKGDGNMPWVREDVCDGCMECVERCPVTAISIGKGMKARIHADKCVQCGTCREACPRGAVRPDNERLPAEVKANVRRIRTVLRLRRGPFLQGKALRCVVDHYETQKRSAEATLRALAGLYGRKTGRLPRGRM